MSIHSAPDSYVSSTRVCRVGILAGERQIDMTLPADIPIRTLAVSVVEILVENIGQESMDDIFSRRPLHPGGWTLGRVADSPMPPNSTLQECNVSDGSLLVLAWTNSREKSPLVVDDVTDAVSRVSQDRFQSWSSDSSRRMGATIAVMCYASAALLVGLFAIIERQNVAAGWFCLNAAVASLIAAWITRNRLNNAVAATVFVGGSYLLAAVGGFTAVPSRWSAYNFILAAGAVTAVAVVSITLLRIAVLLGVSMGASGALMLASATVAELFQTSDTGLGTGLTLISMLMLSLAPRLSIIASRIPLPQLPPMGVRVSDIEPAQKQMIFSNKREFTAEKITLPSSNVFERRAVTANRYLCGLVWTSAAGTGIGLLLVLSPGNNRPWLSAIFSALTLYAIIRRARCFADRWQVAPLLGVGAIVVLATMVRFALADGRAVAVIVTVAILLLFSLLTLIAGFKLPGATFNPVQRKIGEWTEFLAVASLFPLGLWIVDAYSIIRTLR
ncbi:type VII secretion integral membrane protein EccD [Mycobacterium sp.]|uniref:type VII secretion integral membrane protein EccD n=1 Tax=Mycobacterium sp. TaxID=1785 RepID=UPI003BAD1CB7